MEREKTKQIRVGNLVIGGNNHVIIQSMTNTKTKDINSTVNQILALEKAGCELVRVAVKDSIDASAIKEIKKQIHIPLVADIHFDYKLAILAIENGADKIRLNPGNIENKEHIKLVVDKCKEYNIPIRIGVNTGSLPSDLNKTPADMIEAAKRQIQILEDNDFYNIILSFKASNIKLMVDTYRLASKTFDYPLHLGITEAGGPYSGLVKSSIGIGSLLLDGIGDTIRVSLTGDPVLEIKACKEILKDLNLRADLPIITSCPTCGRTEYDMIPILNQVEDYLDTIHKKIHVAIMGCVVNGPGEAKDADIAICGGKDEALIYIKGQILKKVKQDQILDELKILINEYK